MNRADQYTQSLTHHYSRQFGAAETLHWPHGPTHQVPNDFHVFDSQAHPDSPDRRVAKLTMRFEKAEIEELRGFQHQNPFSDLMASEFRCPNRSERRLRFEFGVGWRMKFTSGSVLVLGIEPYTPPDRFARFRDS